MKQAACVALATREVVRFFRQRSRVMGALLTPVIFWIFLGYGFGNSFQTSGFGQGYQGYFFPGVLLLVLMFSSIFSMISLIEDRKEGFLQSVAVSPVSSGAIVGGKVLGTVIISTIQLVLVAFLAPLAGFDLSVLMIFKLVIFSVVISTNMALFGFALAWRSRSVQGFHVLMNLILMPMWLLSGATFPMEGAAHWIVILMKLNPMTYANLLMQNPFYHREWIFPLTVVVSTSVIFLIWSIFQMKYGRDIVR
ncbi:MAG: ABC transporter permease [Bdellovibrionales bacterium]|nr:ABC transporter permease [Bdellovibrionales bacterium]